MIIPRFLAFVNLYQFICKRIFWIINGILGNILFKRRETAVCLFANGGSFIKLFHNETQRVSFHARQRRAFHDCESNHFTNAVRRSFHSYLHFPVRANDLRRRNVIIPTSYFLNRIPFCHRAVKRDARQAPAILECIFANRCHAVGNNNTC